MARLIETEPTNPPSTGQDTPNTTASLKPYVNKNMSSVDVMNNSTTGPRKFSFKTKQHSYNHSHFQQKLVGTKIKINPNSSVAELANKFNAIIIEDGEKTNRRHVILKRKHSTGNVSNKAVKDLPNNVKEAIRLFEKSTQNEQNNNITSNSKLSIPTKITEESHEQVKKSSKIIIIRKNSAQKVEKSVICDGYTPNSEPVPSLKRSDIEFKGTSCETCLPLPQIRSTSMESKLNDPSKFRQTFSIKTNLHQSIQSNKSRNECESLLANIRNNLRHTSMINLNSPSNRIDHSYQHKLSDKCLINKCNILKPELKPKPGGDLINDRRKSISDIQYLLRTASQDTIDSKSKIQNGFLYKKKIQVTPYETTNLEYILSSCNVNIDNIEKKNSEKSDDKKAIFSDATLSTEHKDKIEYVYNRSITNSNSSSSSPDIKKSLESEDKLIKNKRLSIPKLSSEFENVLNHRNENNEEHSITSNKEIFPDQSTLKDDLKPNKREINNEREIIEDHENNIKKTNSENNSRCSHGVSALTTNVPSKPNSSFLWRSVSKDSKTSNTSGSGRKDEEYDDIVINEDEHEIYTYIELNNKDKIQETLTKNTSSLHSHTPSTYQSLPNLNQDLDEDTYEELNYYSGKIYLPDVPEKRLQSTTEMPEKAPKLPEKNNKQGNTINAKSTQPDINSNVDGNQLLDTGRDYENKYLPDLLKRGDGENLYHESKFSTKGSRPILSNIDDKYATIVKPLKRDHAESIYNYESILSVKDENHYNSIQDDAEVYDDVLNVIQIDNCYESIQQAMSECGSFWEKDNSIYGIKAPSILSNNSTISTASGFQDTSDEWVDVDQSDHEEHIFVYLPKKVSRSSMKKKGWIQKVRRQRSKLSNVRQILTPKKETINPPTPA
uniref:Uncharacterized protein n=3 Tax=Cacopsylla melanoneura TaxID=428564 RepID=A0A8D9E0D2_9HEMI